MSEYLINSWVPVVLDEHPEWDLYTDYEAIRREAVALANASLGK